MKNTLIGYTLFFYHASSFKYYFILSLYVDGQENIAFLYILFFHT